MGQQYEKYGNMKHHGNKQIKQDKKKTFLNENKLVSTIQKNTLDILSSYYPQYEKHIRVKYIPIGLNGLYE